MLFYKLGHCKGLRMRLPGLSSMVLRDSVEGLDAISQSLALLSQLLWQLVLLGRQCAPSWDQLARKVSCCLGKCNSCGSKAEGSVAVSGVLPERAKEVQVLASRTGRG